MTIIKLSDSLPSEEIILRHIVRAIQKAVEEDMPEYYSDNHMETMNAARYVRSDLINDNLRNIVTDEHRRLVPFKRYSWDGRILLDELTKSTYTITTRQTLMTIPKKKDRKHPHFLQSLISVENSELEGKNVQLSFFPTKTFDKKVLEEDYNEIVSGALAPNSGYQHYVIAYEFNKYQLTNIMLILLDKNFNTVDEISLNYLMKPNFANLTNTTSESDEEINDTKSARGLVALKPGIKPDLIKLQEEDQA